MLQSSGIRRLSLWPKLFHGCWDIGTCTVQTRHGSTLCRCVTGPGHRMRCHAAFSFRGDEIVDVDLLSSRAELFKKLDSAFDAVRRFEKRDFSFFVS